MKRKTGALALLTLLLAALAIGGTYAWLKDQTQPVTNTFTVGSVRITLDEALAQKDAAASTWSVGDARVQSNTFENIYPGARLPRDPTVHVAADSAEALVYVCIRDGLNAAVPGAAVYALAPGWTAVDGSGGTVYRCAEAACAGEDLLVFDGVTISAGVSAAELPALEGTALEVTAFAMQAAGVDSRTADAQALAAFGLTA